VIWLAVGLVLWELCRGEEGRRVAARLGGRSLLLLALFALADAAVPWCLPHLQAQWWCLPGVLLWQCSAALPPLWVSLRFRSKWRWVAVLFWFPVLLLSLTVVRLPMVATPAAVGFDHAHRPFEVRSADGTLLRGLHFPRATPRGLVLLVHGIGAEKCQFLPAVRPLWDLGYEVWTFDQRGHGLSGGWLSSLGVREAEDVAAVWRFVVENTSLPRHRKQPQLLYGVSLGGAAAQGAAPGLEGCAGMILD